MGASRCAYAPYAWSVVGWRFFSLHCEVGKLLPGKRRKRFFFEKKEPKTFALGLVAGLARSAIDKSFCFFFQKEALSFCMRLVMTSPGMQRLLLEIICARRAGFAICFVFGRQELSRGYCCDFRPMAARGRPSPSHRCAAGPSLSRKRGRGFFRPAGRVGCPAGSGRRLFPDTRTSSHCSWGRFARRRRPGGWSRGAGRR